LDILDVTALSIAVYPGEVLASPFRVSPFQNHRFLLLYLDAPSQKFLHTSLSGVPQKCFQSASALAKAGSYDSDIQRQVKSLFCSPNKLRGTFAQCSPCSKKHSISWL